MVVALPMALWVRVSGWIVSLTGAVLLLSSGGFGEDVRNPYAWVGAFLMVFGMILTSSSGLIAHLQHMKRLREKMQEHGDPPAPPK
jgi:hypothetical protein